MRAIYHLPFTLSSSPFCREPVDRQGSSLKRVSASQTRVLWDPSLMADVTLEVGVSRSKVPALINSGADSSFLSMELVKSLQIPLQTLQSTLQVQAARCQRDCRGRPATRLASTRPPLRHCLRPGGPGFPRSSVQSSAA